MAGRFRLRQLVSLAFILITLAGSASMVFGQQTLDPKDFESNSLLFVQQDVLPSFGAQTGVRIGTIKGTISGNITTNFFFTIPPQGPPGGTFVADDRALVVDPEGNQILFEIHAEGVSSFDSLAPEISLFRAPFIATYKVLKATGKLSKYEGLVFPARGTGVISTPLFLSPGSPTPVGTVYVEVSRNPMKK